MISMTAEQVEHAARMRLKGASLGRICRHFGIGRNNLNRHLINHPLLVGTRLSVGPRASLMAQSNSDEKPTPAELASIELRRQNILYLLELKRQGYSPTRTELSIAPDRFTYSRRPSPASTSSWMGSPAAACAGG